MLENIRKYTGLFIVVLVLIFIGLVFFQSQSGGSGPGSGPPVVKTNDKTYTTKDLMKAEQKIRLGQRLAAQSNEIGPRVSYFGTEASMDITTFLGTLEANGDEENGLRTHLVYRTIFENTKKDFGLYPSDDEIQLYQQEKIFTNREGIFDDEAYTKFTDKGLKGMGMTVNDVNDFVGDLLSFKALQNILSSGVVANEQAAQDQFLASQQEITLSALSLDLESFKTDIDPSEDEVKTYWEENKGRYLTEAKRKLTYLLESPSFDEALAKKKEEVAQAEKTPGEKAADAEMTPEEIAEAEKAKVEKVTLTPQERKKVIDEFGLVIDDEVCVTLQLAIDNGAKKADLESAIAKEDNKGTYELKTTELVPLSELPEAFKGPVRGTQGRTVEQELQDANLNTGDVMDTISPVLGVGEEQWLFFRVDEAVDPAEKTFEEAQEQARADLIDEKAKEALKEAIEAAREEVATAVAAGTSLEEAAKAQNLKVTEQLGLGQYAQVPGEPNANDLFRLAKQTKTGEVSKAEIIQPEMDRGVFVYVQERDFVESDQNKSGLERAAERDQQIMSGAVVQHWFRAQFNEAEAEFLRN